MKAHKKHEFYCKVSVAAASRDNWLFGIEAHHANHYKGHTLTDVNTDAANFGESGIKTN